MVAVPTLGCMSAPHMFRSSFGRTAKSRVWPIRHWGREARSNPVGRSRDRYIFYPFAVFRTVHTRKQSNSLDAVIDTRERPPQRRFIVGCSSTFMLLSQHLTALRAWCKQCLPGRWKADVLRVSIVGMRGSMVTRLRPCMT